MRSRAEAGMRLLLDMVTRLALYGLPSYYALRVLSLFEMRIYLSVAVSLAAPNLSCVRSLRCNKEYQGCYIVDGMCHCAKAFCCNNPFKYPSLDSCLANNTQQLGKLYPFWFRELLSIS